MADQEIDVIRAILLANPRPEELSERRKRLDDLGARYKIASEQSLLAARRGGYPFPRTPVLC